MIKVSPAVVEKVILQHDAVAECGVVGKPDEFSGELPTAFVVLKAGYNVTEQELLRFTTERVCDCEFHNLQKNRLSLKSVHGRYYGVITS